MSKDQQVQVLESFDQEKIIKIVKEQSVLNDCILFSDYTAWQANSPKPGVGPAPSQPAYQATIGKLAFK